ncbi:MAG: VanZ family protein [Gammaproteobacteria bacterium]|nr:VanZ family protein [Gammaproteobacteria bacterium]MCF6261894.1 VanZ family protein [Gammaproteobacteria bacterium]
MPTEQDVLLGRNTDLLFPVSPNSFQLLPLWLTIGWGLIALIVYLSLTASPPEVFEFAFADKLKHLFAYSVLMGWFTQLYPSLKARRVWALALFLLGVAVEFIQGWSGYRFFDVADMAANSLGVLLGWWLSTKWLAGSLLRVDSVLSRWSK